MSGRDLYSSFAPSQLQGMLICHSGKSQPIEMDFENDVFDWRSVTFSPPFVGISIERRPLL